MNTIDASDIDIIVSELEDNADGFMGLTLPELNMNISVQNGSHFVKLEIFVHNYSINNNSDCTEICCKIEETIYGKGEIPKVLKYLNTLFRDDGSLRYSKLTDKVYNDEDEMKHFEKIEKAKLAITKQTENFSCCVCKEPNKIFTVCSHNLCRYCFTKIYMSTKCCEDHCSDIPCPICRGNIN
jgi:hypothetical protein